MEARKRGRSDAFLNGNGGFKKNKPEMENFTSGIGSKSKPCMKFFSFDGCPYGESCHFLHYVPGGINPIAHMTNSSGNHSYPPSSRNMMGPPSIPNGAPVAVKTRMCNKMNTAEGCKFGDKCHFAHSESELGKSMGPSHEDPRSMGPMSGRFPARHEPTPPGLAAAASFGASATAKISVDASLAGAIIGKGGVNSKQICRVTGVKLYIRDHESDANLKNIELEGTFDQIKQASAMVRELIVSIASATGPPSNPAAAIHGTHPGANNFKTKLCEHFTQGSCTYGDRCHFAHGENELRKSGM